MEFNCISGATFILCGHLWVIISDPFNDPKKVIWAHVTSKKQNSDTTVILYPPDHDFITHTSVINYADARVEPISYIISSINQRNFEARQKFEDSATIKIQQGLLKSTRTPKFIKKLYQDFCL